MNLPSRFNRKQTLVVSFGMNKSKQLQNFDRNIIPLLELLQMNAVRFTHMCVENKLLKKQDVWNFLFGTSTMERTCYLLKCVYNFSVELKRKGKPNESQCSINEFIFTVLFQNFATQIKDGVQNKQEMILKNLEIICWLSLNACQYFHSLFVSTANCKNIATFNDFMCQMFEHTCRNLVTVIKLVSKSVVCEQSFQFIVNPLFITSADHIGFHILESIRKQIVKDSDNFQLLINVLKKMGNKFEKMSNVLNS